MGSWRNITVACRDNLGINLVRDYISSRKQPDAVFIWIPKTAGTSVCQAIRARKHKSVDKVRFRFSDQGVVTFGHMSYAELIRNNYVSCSFDTSAFKFAVVRDPYDRAVSLYCYLKMKNKVAPGQDFLSFLRLLNESEIQPIGLYNVHGYSQCNPQVRWIENVRIDFLGRLENLDSDLAGVQHRLGLDKLIIPHDNATRRDRTSSYYCRESTEIVEHIYREDFAAFGYEVWPRN